LAVSTMHFSEEFHLRRAPERDWFDTILDADTQLFVDPFLLFRDSSRLWQQSHTKIIGHFNLAFKLIAQNHNPESLSYKKALHLLTFH